MTTPTYLPPPQRCEPLASLVARFGGTFELRASAESIEYQLPMRATPEIRAFWQTESTAESSAEFTARLPNGRVFGAGSVLAPDGTSIARDVSLDFGKPPESHWLLTYGKIPPPRSLSGTTAVIATTLGSGYGHWLLDELPRLLTLPRNQAQTLIAHARHPFSRVALDHWGWTGTVVYPERDAHFQCEDLLVPSLRGTVIQPTRRGLDLVTDFTSAFPPSRSGHGERIYLTRETARRRQVTNESELWSTLQGAGFSKLQLEHLTWAEQIDAFRQAKVIVSPHGAGLANLVFCRPGTRVVELFNRSYVHGCYWRVASLQQLDYWPVVGISSEPLGQASPCNRLAIHADLSQVRAALNAA